MTFMMFYYNHNQSSAIIHLGKKKFLRVFFNIPFKLFPNKNETQPVNLLFLKAPYEFSMPLLSSASLSQFYPALRAHITSQKSISVKAKPDFEQTPGRFNKSHSTTERAHAARPSHCFWPGVKLIGSGAKCSVTSANNSENEPHFHPYICVRARWHLTT